MVITQCYGGMTGVVLSSMWISLPDSLNYLAVCRALYICTD